MDRGYSPQQFVALFGEVGAAKRDVERIFKAEFGADMPRGVGVNVEVGRYFYRFFSLLI